MMKGGRIGGIHEGNNWFIIVYLQSRIASIRNGFFYKLLHLMFTLMTISYY